VGDRLQLAALRPRRGGFGTQPMPGRMKRVIPRHTSPLPSAPCCAGSSPHWPGLRRRPCPRHLARPEEPVGVHARVARDTVDHETIFSAWDGTRDEGAFRLVLRLLAKAVDTSAPGRRSSRPQESRRPSRSEAAALRWKQRTQPLHALDNVLEARVLGVQIEEEIEGAYHIPRRLAGSPETVASLPLVTR
jgi:hypothetical protein